MHIGRRQIIGALGLLAAGCGGGGDASPAAVARYRLTLRKHWLPAHFPTMFPATAHFTALVGATHGDAVVFFARGALATTGVRHVAERGDTAAMLDEIDRAIAAGSATAAVSAPAVLRDADEGVLEFELQRSQPRLTLLTMLGPSPDWFTGFSGVALHDGGGWLDMLRLELPAYDAGTDDGASFLSPDAPSSPPLPVQRLSTDAAASDFVDGRSRLTGSPVATAVFERIA